MSADAVGIKPAERLQRWEEAGAVWRVMSRRPDSVTVALLRCDAGEEVERLQSQDPDVIAYVAGRDSSEESFVDRWPDTRAVQQAR